jgi:hypothetical protein
MQQQEQEHHSPDTRTSHPWVEWALDHKLKSIGYTWLGGIVGSLAYQWSRPIPTSLKIIHSRVYAQAITLGALGSMAALETYARTLGVDAGHRKDGME